MGGIIGNLYDRLGLWHAADVFVGHQNGVRDWILFNQMVLWIHGT